MCDQHELGDLIRQLKLPFSLSFKCSLFKDTFSTKMVALTTIGLFKIYRERALTLERSLTVTNSIGSADRIL